MQQFVQVHITGAGDFSLSGVTSLADPCPLPSAAKKRGLRDKEKLFYAPMSGLGDLLYDKDAVYININDHLVQFSNTDDNDASRKKGTANGLHYKYLTSTPFTVLLVIKVSRSMLVQDEHALVNKDVGNVGCIAGNSNF
jgi:predicted GNAT family acetyltransferase